MDKLEKIENLTREALQKIEEADEILINIITAEGNADKNKIYISNKLCNIILQLNEILDE